MVLGIVPGELERFTVGGSGCVERTAYGLQRQLGAAVVAVWPSLPKWGDRTEHQSWVDSVQHLPAPAGLGRFPRREVFDHDIDLASESPNRSGAVVGMRINDNRLLVGVQEEEESGRLEIGALIGKRSELSGRIAAARFRLDHASAIVGQQL